MAYVKVDKEVLDNALTSMANVIREKLDSSDNIQWNENRGFSDSIEEVADCEYSSGFSDGKKAEWSAFWDAFQHNGERRNYEFAFRAGCFSVDTFFPKYDIICGDETTQIQMFYNFEGYRANNGTSTQFSLKKRLEECGVVLDTSKAKNLQGMFTYCSFTEIPTIDLTGITASTGTQSMFGQCWGRLVTIEKIITKESVTYTSMFTNDTGLVNVTFEGVIGNDIDFQSCKALSKASITSVINALSSTVSGKISTFSKDAVNNAFTTEEWEALVATKQNWTIVV